MTNIPENRVKYLFFSFCRLVKTACFGEIGKVDLVYWGVQKHKPHMKNKSKEVTLFQSEELKIGERGPYVSRHENMNQKCKELGVEMWVQKEIKPLDEWEKNLATFISIPRWQHVYGITYKGKDHVCGDMPRDPGKVVRGIRIATES